MNSPLLSRRAFIAASALSALALAGCSVNPDSEPATDDTPSLDEVNESVASEMTAALRFYAGSCNPVNASSPLFIAAGWHVFEHLFELDLHTYRTSLGLASDVPVQVSDLKYEVTLRKDACFSSGDKLTVDDVCASFARFKKSDVYSPHLAFISSITAKDEQTVSFTLNAPLGSLLQQRLSLVPITPASLSDEELEKTPLGSGPWSYDTADITDGGSISFVPNAFYAGQHPATCERMTWHLSSDEENRANLLAAEEVVCAEDITRDFADNAINAGANVEYVPGYNPLFLLFNCLKKPFNNAAVRQGLLFAIDTDYLIAEVMGGHARACTSLLPDYYRDYQRASTTYSFDKEKAQSLLAEAQVKPEKVSIKLRCEAGRLASAAQLIAKNWEDIGINVTVEQYDASEIFSDISTPPKDAHVLPFDIVLSQEDPSLLGNDIDLMINWWYGDTPWTRARSCWAQTEEFSTLQTLIEQAHTATNEEEQQCSWSQCLDLIAREVPLYPLFHSEQATAFYDQQLDNYDPLPTAGLLFLGTTPLKEIE